MKNLAALPYYSLKKDERALLSEKINQEIISDIENNVANEIHVYFSDEDTYIRKAAYIATGRIYMSLPSLRKKIISLLKSLSKEEDPKIRQTSINAAGEIGMKDFEVVESFFDAGLFDKHHSVRNAVIGSIKKMGEKNPLPVLGWAKKYLHHPDKEVRREICHGIELRGRKHPEDILPLLQELENDKTARVSNTLVHVLGQISYKKSCLYTVIEALNGWENKVLTAKAVEEIIDVHERYKNFAVLSQEEAREYILKNFNPSSSDTHP